MNISNISNEEYELSGLTFKGLMNQQYCVFDFEGTGASSTIRLTIRT